MTRHLLAVLLAVWLPCASVRAAAQACPPARVGVSDLGYSSYLDGTVMRGSNIDMLTEIQKRSGCPLAIRWYPRSRLYAMFFNRSLEMTGASLRSEERDRYGTWLPYTYTRFELVLMGKDAASFRSLEDFVDRGTARLNITRGVFYSAATQRQLDRLEQRGRLEYVSDFGVVFRKIKAGRAEGTLAPATIHLLNQRQFGLYGKMSATPVAESPRMMVGLYVSNQVPPHVLQRYADALRSIVADGTMETFYERYLGAEIAHRLTADGTRALLAALPPPR
ncbi:polar amino acid transport system substrate-binding protein [Duganella sp. 1224]|uniref:substrate-binding periplasmic protein n=1 Tax=Duganella sp. 1224 TaxID=2587052 RepID=UPI0015C97AB3|nr:ABC transporter substrate-binding protein [Duganella sp. 1224]NYE62729.1 polar amino acid transport system substrate-binding protein [Duganella sp. 1224]